MKEPIYKVKLTKVRSNHTNIRTETTEGRTMFLPKKGNSFILIGEALTPGADFRSIYTTEIQNVEQMGNEYMFQTQNSTYKVEVLGVEE